MAVIFNDGKQTEDRENCSAKVRNLFNDVGETEERPSAVIYSSGIA